MFRTNGDAQERTHSEFFHLRFIENLAFQTRLGLAPSGIRDADTRLAIIHNAVILPDNGETPDRSKREKVTSLQRKLYSHGQYFGPQHGLYDAQTIAAVSAFQIRHKLPRRE